MYKDTSGNPVTYELTNKSDEKTSGQKRVLFSDKTNDKDRSHNDYYKRPRNDARKEGHDGRKCGGKSSIAHLSSVICKCDDINHHALYRKCCLSINRASATPVNVLFDTDADPISFVIRKIATWIRTQTGRCGEHDDNDSRTIGIVALAETSITCSTYGLI